MNEIEKDIHEMADKFTKAWNDHDAKAFGDLFAEDADFTNVFGQAIRGRSAIGNFHATLFLTMFKASTFNVIEAKSRLIKDDIAALDVTWGMTGATDPSGNPWQNRKGLMSLILKYENEEWLILIMHNMDLPVAPKFSAQ